ARLACPRLGAVCMREETSLPDAGWSFRCVGIRYWHQMLARILAVGPCSSCGPPRHGFFTQTGTPAGCVRYAAPMEGPLAHLGTKCRIWQAWRPCVGTSRGRRKSPTLGRGDDQKESSMRTARTLIAALFGLVALGAPALGDVLDDIKQRGTLIVGVKADYK